MGGVVNFFTSSTSGEFAGEDLFNNSRFYSDEELDNASLIRSNLSFDITKTPSLENTTPQFYASIVEILNEKTVLVDDPFNNKNLDGSKYTLPIFGQDKYSLRHYLGILFRC